MGTVEVFTIGGGEYIVNVLNAVAAWTGDGGYKGMIQVVFVMGLAYAVLCLAFDQNWRALLRWFLGSTLIYMALMVPRDTVVVTDRINPSLAPNVVANVPIGLALVASFTSQLSDYLTQKAEVVFGLPNQMNYSQNGMIYGARLYQATQQVRINDPIFATNLDTYYKTCTFYDIALGFKTMQVLANSTDLWADLGPGSQARSMPFLGDDGNGGQTSTILTCNQSYTNLGNQWTAAIKSTGTALGRQLYSKLLGGAAQAKLFGDLPVATQYLLGVSQDASAQLKQTLSINALTQAMHSVQNGPTSVDVYAQTRAEMQTANTYSSISYAAMKWVPLLNIVLTVLFYALFPILFPLFLFPRTGPTALTGYITGFFYLAVWGPLYVILNMILMIKTSSDAVATASTVTPGLTLASYVGISGVMSDASLLAGYLIASVPFLAGGIARGAMAISGAATSFLAPSQSAAEEAAREASTGNISIGNTSLDNQNLSNKQWSQWTTAGAYTGGSSAFTTVNRDGTRSSQFGGGTHEVVDQASGISRFDFAPQLSHELQSSFSRNASQARSRAETLSNSASSSVSTALTNASDYRNQLSAGTTLEQSYGADDRNTINNTYSKLDQAATQLQNRFGWDRSKAQSVAAEAFFTGSLTTNLGVGLGGGGSSIGAGLEARSGYSKRTGTTAQFAASDGLSEARDYLSNVAKSENWSDQRDTFLRASKNTSNASLRSRAESVGSSLSRANSTSQDARRSYEEASRFDRAASLRDSSGVSLSENLSQPFFEYVQAEQQRTGPHGVSHAWNPSRGIARTPDEIAERDYYVHKFIKQREDLIRAGVEPELLAPVPAGISRPGASTQAGIRKLYNENSGSVPGEGALGAAPTSDYQLGRAQSDRAGTVEKAGVYVDERLGSREGAFRAPTANLSQNPAETIKNVDHAVDKAKPPTWRERVFDDVRDALDLK